ncbi:unnamed protein product [Nyctereutes procyonoides]|uniref:(raccoon dog) hypothetical protein n=1 Tax=Nyctereutes procyonoides TaxID=34880 RepID=A0A811ZD36_NYCPR|nr:unnamed protein product [Nyctereutes procyonoides]
MQAGRWLHVTENRHGLVCLECARQRQDAWPQGAPALGQLGHLSLGGKRPALAPLAPCPQMEKLLHLSRPEKLSVL